VSDSPPRVNGRAILDYLTGMRSRAKKFASKKMARPGDFHSPERADSTCEFSPGERRQRAAPTS